MDPIDILNSLLGMDADPSLTDLERKVCLLNTFESECMNGGWEQYIWNSSGDQAEQLHRYLAEFRYTGTLEAFSLLRKAMGGEIPKDREERITRLDKIRPDEALRERIHNLMDAEVTGMFDDICDYIRAHEADFAELRRKREPGT
jgi:hypothetical protein